MGCAGLAPCSWRVPLFCAVPTPPPVSPACSAARAALCPTAPQNMREERHSVPERRQGGAGGSVLTHLWL